VFFGHSAINKLEYWLLNTFIPPSSAPIFAAFGIAVAVSQWIASSMTWRASYVRRQKYASSGNADSLNFASARELIGQEMLVERGLEESFRVSKKDRFDTRTYETQHRV
jgi:hypothetical protein